MNATLFTFPKNPIKQAHPGPLQPIPLPCEGALTALILIDSAPPTTTKVIEETEVSCSLWILKA